MVGTIPIEVMFERRIDMARALGDANNLLVLQAMAALYVRQTRRRTCVLSRSMRSKVPSSARPGLLGTIRVVVRGLEPSLVTPRRHPVVGDGVECPQ